MKGTVELKSFLLLRTTVAVVVAISLMIFGTNLKPFFRRKPLFCFFLGREFQAGFLSVTIAYQAIAEKTEEKEDWNIKTEETVFAEFHYTFFGKTWRRLLM